MLKRVALIRTDGQTTASDEGFITVEVNDKEKEAEQRDSIYMHSSIPDPHSQVTTVAKIKCKFPSSSPSTLTC